MKDNSYSIGVDLGGTNLRIAAYTHHAGLLETILLPTRLAAGRDAVVSDMCKAIETLRDRFSAAHELAGIGIGTPGPLELPAGVLHNPPNLTGWDGFDLRTALVARAGVRAVVGFVDGLHANRTAVVVGDQGRYRDHPATPRVLVGCRRRNSGSGRSAGGSLVDGRGVRDHAARDRHLRHGYCRS